MKKRSKSRVSGVDRFLSFVRFLMATLIVLGVVAFISQQIWPNNPFAEWRNPDARGLTGDQFKGLVVSGLSQGAMYGLIALGYSCLLYTSPSPRDRQKSRMPSSA